ncbi:MAG: pyridoxal-dependent decarboxylase, partial [Candidatus Aminicenantes bacterium]|nr:pyridoxal-dependent decarboxylase [Candidatus Aminicenantes bacterium]
MDKDTFRTFGHRFVDWIADYMEGLEHLPVTPSLRPGDIQSRLPKEAPVQGEDMEKIFADFRTVILPGMTHWQHPSWFAYFPANNSPPSILAEILTAGMG